MSTQLIPEELNELILQYLTDGVLTDKERQVILKKAEGMGLDRDEIDLYLDAEVQKIDQQTDAAVRKQKGKTCPYCGGSIPQLTEKCPHCGENVTAQASEELQEIFDNLEEALIDMKAGDDIDRSKATVERYARKARMYYGNNPKIQKLLSDIEKETIEAENRAKVNARKNAIVQFISSHKSIFILAIVILVPIFSIKKCMNDSDQEEAELKQQYEQQYELDKPQIDEQYERLCQSLDDLATPNKSNYKEMTRKLQKIVWTDISKGTYIKDAIKGGTIISNQYEYNKKHAFVELKRAYAEELKTIYKQVYNYNDGGGNSSYDNNTPDDIKYPININH